MKPKIKICGIKNLAEAKSVLECKFNGLRVDFLGLIFADSKRKVSTETAREISRLAHSYGVQTVGVFVDTGDDEILKICEFASLDVAQIYKEISAELKRNLNTFGMQAWQVVRIKDEIPSLQNLHFDKILFDYKGEMAGGNGVSFDFKLLKNVRKPFIIAGGIGVENLCDALAFAPFCVDINSKVEDENGIKMPNKIAKILKLRAQN